MALDIMGNVKAEVDMYVGGGGMAAIGHYADQQPANSTLAQHNVTNAEALFGLDILAGAFLRGHVKGRVRGMLDGSVAYSAGALIDRALKGRFSTTTPAAGSTVTGLEVMDPNGNWGADTGSGVGSGASAGSGAMMDYGESSDTGIGLD